MVDRFESKAEVGDVVLLRAGLKSIVGVGVLGPYGYEESGIAGWDLYHVRSTNWLDEDKTAKWVETLAKGAVFPAKNQVLSQSRFVPLNLQQWSELFGQAVEIVQLNSLDAPPLPPKKQPTTMNARDFLAQTDRIRRRLGASGTLDIGNLEMVIDAARDFSTEADYDRSEADTTGMVVLPLLRALGVRDGKIRIEVPLKAFGVEGSNSAKRVDVVVIGDSIAEPKLVIEAKRRWKGLDYAGQQGSHYRDKISTACGRGEKSLPLVLTDGAEFEITGLPSGSPDDSQYLSLRWLDKDGARALAGLANYLSTDRP
jgi:hypothetical protein